MKTRTLASLILVIVIGVASLNFVTVGAQAQQTSEMARVKKLNGKLVFVLSEPTQPYDILEQKSNSFRNFMLGKESIDEQLTKFIKAGIKNGVEFDGVLTDDGTNVLMIKFK